MVESAGIMKEINPARHFVYMLNNQMFVRLLETACNEGAIGGSFTVYGFMFYLLPPSLILGDVRSLFWIFSKFIIHDQHVRQVSRDCNWL